MLRRIVTVLRRGQDRSAHRSSAHSADERAREPRQSDRRLSKPAGAIDIHTYIYIYTHTHMYVHMYMYIYIYNSHKINATSTNNDNNDTIPKRTGTARGNLSTPHGEYD